MMAADGQALRENYRFLARYNRWFNERLYEACARLPDDSRKADRGAFFASIHGTLNHLLWADRLWLRRFADQGVAFPSLTGDVLALPERAAHATVLYDSWDKLRDERARLDRAIDEWVRDMPPGFPLQLVRYSNTRGVWREHPAWQALTHFFNHQTHHRGQVTTLLAQAGIDPGITDLIALVGQE